MTKGEAKVLCQTPTPGKKGTRISKWKYDLVRAAILKAAPDNETGVEFKRLPALVKKHLSEADLQRLGSLSWYTTTVKLDLKVVAYGLAADRHPSLGEPAQRTKALGLVTKVITSLCVKGSGTCRLNLKENPYGRPIRVRRGTAMKRQEHERLGEVI